MSQVRLVDTGDGVLIEEAEVARVDNGVWFVYLGELVEAGKVAPDVCDDEDAGAVLFEQTDVCGCVFHWRVCCAVCCVVLCQSVSAAVRGGCWAESVELFHFTETNSCTNYKYKYN